MNNEKGTLTIRTGTEVVRKVWDGTKDQNILVRGGMVVLIGAALTFEKICQMAGVERRKG